MFRKKAAAPERKRSNTGITATARARFMRISIHIGLLADMYDFQGKTCPCIESVRAGFGKKGLEATVGLLQGPVNGRAQQRSAERKEQEADAEQPAFGARSESWPRFSVQGERWPAAAHWGRGTSGGEGRCSQEKPFGCLCPEGRACRRCLAGALFARNP